jgi:hypothetical protein
MAGRRTLLQSRSLLGGLAIVALVAAWQLPLPAQTGGAILYAVTPSNRLLTFSSSAPGTILNNVPITNLQTGERIVGIDMRPANNWLYGLGSTSQLYVINQVTGAAIRIGAPFTPALAGTEFGVDFNPTVDRIRVVSDTGQNLRLHPDTGAVAGVDLPLNYAAGDANAGRTPGVDAVAYTNPDNDPATGTTLFDIDSALDTVAIQNPPNNGTLNTNGALGVGAVRVGFDIGLTDFYAAIQLDGSTTSTLFIMSGPQRLNQGTIGGGEPVSSLAVSLGTPFSPPVERVFAVNAAGELISFNADQAFNILSRVAISGLNASERIAGMDFRPANNLLYGLGTSNQLYIIDTRTGIASRVGGTLSVPLSGAELGFDFNPTVDRLRVVSDARQNLRLHPDTAAVAFVDGTLAYGAADPNAGRVPRVVAAAYTNPDNNPATGTTLFVIDSSLDIGATQDPPNAGTLNTFATLGGDAGDVMGFDISLTRILIASAPTAASASVLVDVTSGTRILGPVGNGETIRALAISLGR